MTATKTGQSLRALLADHGVQPDSILPAMIGAQAWWHLHEDINAARCDERDAQLAGAFGHARGEPHTAWADRCITCRNPFPCLGFYRDIDNGEMTP